jgi:hypothetical protein
MVLPLREIFIPESGRWVYPKAKLPELELHEAFIGNMIGRLGIFYKGNSGTESNVCFANSRDLRPEFRTSFRKTDVIYYLSAFLPGSDVNLESDEVPFPENVAAFWSFADIGFRKL